MRAFIIGGTGQIGSLVAAGLAERGADVRVLTRDAAKRASLPAGQTAVIGDLDCISVIKQEMDAADGVFMMFPQHDTLSFKGLNAVSVASESRPSNFVMMTALGVDGDLVGVGHCGGMWPAEVALAKTGLAYTILRPNYFFQNDARQRQNIMDRSVYGAPIGDVGLSRVDVRDIAASAVACFERGSTGERYSICGTEVFTGAMSASLWSEVLGKTVTYSGHDDMRRVQANLQAGGLPEHWAYDLCKMYEVWQRDGAIATTAEIDRLLSLLGRNPRSYRAFVEETARQWSDAPAPAATW